MEQVVTVLRKFWTSYSSFSLNWQINIYNFTKMSFFFGTIQKPWQPVTTLQHFHCLGLLIKKVYRTICKPVIVLSLCSFRRVECNEQTKPYVCFAAKYFVKSVRIRSFACSVFFCICSEYRVNFKCSVGVQENIDQKKPVFRYFLRSENIKLHLKSNVFI